MSHRILRDEDDLELWITFLRQRGFPQTVTSKKGADRSLEQNALQFKWAQEAAQQYGDRTFEEVRHDWKLRHGIPILRRDDPTFQAFYDTHLKRLPYPQKLIAMAYIPVTSEFGVRQMTEYLDTVQRECLQNGLRLTDPENA